jgi:hypothetical protein
MGSVVAIAGIDDHHLAVHLDDPALEAHRPAVGLVPEMRLEPGPVRREERLVLAEDGHGQRHEHFLGPSDRRVREPEHRHDFERRLHPRWRWRN